MVLRSVCSTVFSRSVALTDSVEMFVFFFYIYIHIKDGIGMKRFLYPSLYEDLHLILLSNGDSLAVGMGYIIISRQDDGALSTGKK